MQPRFVADREDSIDGAGEPKDINVARFFVNWFLAATEQLPEL